MGLRLGAIALVSALITGCGGDDAPAPVVLSMRDFNDDCTTPICFCDIAEDDCQQHIFDATAELRGEEPGVLPTIRSLSVDEIREEFLGMAMEEGLLEPTPWDAPLQMLKLIPTDRSMAETIADDFLVGVAAFYSWDTREVTIVQGNTPDDALTGSVVLSHEFVHVLQDRDQGLQALRDTWVDSTDTSTALRHLFEGEADVISTVTLILGSGGRDEDDFPWDDYYDLLLESMLDSLQDTTSPFLSVPFNLPYPQGGRVVREFRRTEGQARVEQMYVDGPGGSVDWIGPDAPAGDATLVREPTCVPELPVGDRSALDADSAGSLGLMGLLMSHGMGAADALLLASTLRADVMVIFGQPASPTDGDSQSVEWRMEFATSADALEVQRVVQSPSIGVAVDGVALRLWAAGVDVSESELAAREGCGDPGVLADALDGSTVRRPTDALDIRARLGAYTGGGRPIRPVAAQLVGR